MNISQEEVDKVVKILEVHGKEIGREAIEESNENCMKIMKYYQMLEKCPEAGMLVLLEHELKEYLKGGVYSC